MGQATVCAYFCLQHSVDSMLCWQKSLSHAKLQEHLRMSTLRLARRSEVKM